MADNNDMVDEGVPPMLERPAVEPVDAVPPGIAIPPEDLPPADHSAQGAVGSGISFLEEARKLDIRKRMKTGLAKRLLGNPGRYEFSNDMETVKMQNTKVQSMMRNPGDLATGEPVDVPFWKVKEYSKNGYKLYDKESQGHASGMSGLDVAETATAAVQGATDPLRDVTLGAAGLVEDALGMERKRGNEDTAYAELNAKRHSGAYLTGSILNTVALGVATPAAIENAVSTLASKYPALWKGSAALKKGADWFYDSQKIAPSIARNAIENVVVGAEIRGIRHINHEQVAGEAATLDLLDMATDAAVGGGFGLAAATLLRPAELRSIARSKMPVVDEIAAAVEKAKSLRSEAAGLWEEGIDSRLKSEALGESHRDLKFNKISPLKTSYPPIRSESALDPAFRAGPGRRFSELPSANADDPYHAMEFERGALSEKDVEHVAKMANAMDGMPAAVNDLKSNISSLLELGQSNPLYIRASKDYDRIMKVSDDIKDMFGIKMKKAPNGEHVYSFASDEKILGQFINSKMPSSALEELQSLLSGALGGNLDDLAVRSATDGMVKMGRKAEEVAFGEASDPTLFREPRLATPVDLTETASMSPGRSSTKGSVDGVVYHSPGDPEAAAVAMTRSNKASNAVREIEASRARQAAWERENVPRIKELEAQAAEIMQRHEAAAMRSEQAMGDAKSAYEQARIQADRAASMGRELAEKIGKKNFGPFEPTAEQMADDAYQNLSNRLGEDVARANAIAENISAAKNGKSELLAFTSYVGPAAFGYSWGGMAWGAGGAFGAKMAMSGKIGSTIRGSERLNRAFDFLASNFLKAEPAVPAATAAVKQYIGTVRGTAEERKIRSEVDQIRDMTRMKSYVGEISNRFQKAIEVAAENDARTSGQVAGAAQRFRDFMERELSMSPLDAFGTYRLSDSDRRKFYLYLVAGTDPFALIRQIESGAAIDSEIVKATQAVWPGVMDAIRGSAYKQLSESGGKDPKKIAQQLDMSPTSTGESVSYAQSAFFDAEGNKMSPQTATKKNLGSLKQITEQLTPADRIQSTSGSVPFAK